MAKKQTVKALEDIVSLFKKPRQRIVKPATKVLEKVEIKPVQSNIEIPNSVTETLKDFNQTVSNLSKQGIEIPESDQRIMRNVLRKYPESFNRTPTKYELPVDVTHKTRTTNYVSNDFNTKDYFAPQKYRNIGNIDAMFEEAANLQMRGLNNAAKQFGSAGLSDAAAIAKGVKPTSFKYKSNTGIVPTPVLQEIVTRRQAPAGTLEWLQQINAKNPDFSTSYLDLFAKNPTYFQKMFDNNGNPIK